MSSRYFRWMEKEKRNLAQLDQNSNYTKKCHEFLDMSAAAYALCEERYELNDPKLDYIAASHELDFETLQRILWLSSLELYQLWQKIDNMRSDINDDATPTFIPPLPPQSVSDLERYRNDDCKIVENAYRKSQMLFSYQLPSPRILEYIGHACRPDNSCLELGSGSGLWAYLLKSQGITCYATDVNPPPATYTLAERLDWTAAIEKYKECRNLLLIWPPPTDWHSVSLVDALANFQGDNIFFIGELGEFTGGQQLAMWLQSDKFQRKVTLPIFVPSGLAHKIQFFHFVLIK